MKIQIEVDEKTGGYIIPKEAPFDGVPVLVRFSRGWVEAWWMAAEKSTSIEHDESDGFQWICFDDEFQKELEEALEWMPLPVAVCDHQWSEWDYSKHPAGARHCFKCGITQHD